MATYVMDVYLYCGGKVVKVPLDAELAEVEGVVQVVEKPRTYELMMERGVKVTVTFNREVVETVEFAAFPELLAFVAERVKKWRELLLEAVRRNAACCAASRQLLVLKSLVENLLMFQPGAVLRLTAVPYGGGSETLAEISLKLLDP